MDKAWRSAPEHDHHYIEFGTAGRQNDKKTAQSHSQPSYGQNPLNNAQERERTWHELGATHLPRCSPPQPPTSLHTGMAHDTPCQKPVLHCNTQHNMMRRIRIRQLRSQTTNVNKQKLNDKNYGTNAGTHIPRICWAAQGRSGRARARTSSFAARGCCIAAPSTRGRPSPQRTHSCPCRHTCRAHRRNYDTKTTEIQTRENKGDDGEHELRQNSTNNNYSTMKTTQEAADLGLQRQSSQKPLAHTVREQSSATDPASNTASAI